MAASHASAISTHKHTGARLFHIAAVSDSSNTSQKRIVGVSFRF